MSTTTRVPLAGLTVLIVEDEYLIALDAQRIVEDAGAANVSLANSVASARQLLDHGARFHVGILDLRLGDEDATPLIDDLLRSDIPFLVATGLNDAVGVTDVMLIRKPYRDAELVHALHSLVALRS